MDRVEFFDQLAARWDEMADPLLALRVRRGLESLGVRPWERVVDVGCGTGVLARCLAPMLLEGAVYALDLAPSMLRVAKSRMDSPRVVVLCGDAHRLPLASGSVDRVFCLACWPHLDDRDAAAREFLRVLRPGGRLHIWHLEGRQTVNAIHQRAGSAVAHDLLEPGEALAEFLRARGFVVGGVEDGPEEYVVWAVAHGPGGRG